MSDAPDPPVGAVQGGAAEPCQRWRLVVARSSDAPAMPQRDVAAAWSDALEGSGLPITATGGTRARMPVSFGAPLPVGMASDGELIDVLLDERWPLWRVREALDGHLPDGWRLVDLFDVWLAGPPLAGRVAAADYRVEIRSDVDPAALERSASALLAADRLPRERAKGAATVTYDLRPLVIDIVVPPGTPSTIRMRTRFHPELGTGRPEEVLAALGDAIGVPIEPVSIVRERLILAEDLP